MGTPARDTPSGVNMNILRPSEAVVGLMVATSYLGRLGDASVDGDDGGFAASACALSEGATRNNSEVAASNIVREGMNRGRITSIMERSSHFEEVFDNNRGGVDGENTRKTRQIEVWLAIGPASRRNSQTPAPLIG